MDMVKPELMVAAALVLQVFATLSIVDGLYIHLWKLRLHQRPASYGEHLWHTARAVLFAPVALILFATASAGPLLWLGVGLALVDQVAGVVDALSERDSRAALGGLGRGEYALHVALASLHAAALALALAARPLAAWSWSAPSTMAGAPASLTMLTVGPIVGGLAVAALHVALAWVHRPTASAHGAASAA